MLFWVYFLTFSSVFFSNIFVLARCPRNSPNWLLIVRDGGQKEKTRCLFPYLFPGSHVARCRWQKTNENQTNKPTSDPCRVAIPIPMWHVTLFTTALCCKPEKSQCLPGGHISIMIAARDFLVVAKQNSSGQRRHELILRQWLTRQMTGTFEGFPNELPLAYMVLFIRWYLTLEILLKDPHKLSLNRNCNKQ